MSEKGAIKKTNQPPRRSRGRGAGQVRNEDLTRMMGAMQVDEAREQRASSRPNYGGRRSQVGDVQQKETEKQQFRSRTFYRGGGNGQRMDAREPTEARSENWSTHGERSTQNQPQGTRGNERDRTRGPTRSNYGGRTTHQEPKQERAKSPGASSSGSSVSRSSSSSKDGSFTTTYYYSEPYKHWTDLNERGYARYTWLHRKPCDSPERKNTPEETQGKKQSGSGSSRGSNGSGSERSAKSPASPKTKE